MPVAQVRNTLIAVLSISGLLTVKPVHTAMLSASEYRELGLRYRQQERYPAAIAALEKSVELDPQTISSRVVLGWTLHLARQEEAASEALRQAIYRDPGDVPALNAMGIVCLVTGNLDDAVAVHSWALMLKPDNEIAYYNLSLAYHGLQKYDWAIATASQAATLEPTNPHPLVAQAIAQWDNGEQSVAQQVYRQAINLDPRYRDRPFLAHLREAGFSPGQIQTTEQVLTASVK